MWTQTYSQTYKQLRAEQAWKVWTDVDSWHEWQDDIDFARLNGPFETGGTFQFKPKGGPEFKLELSEAEAPRLFTNITRFPLARMVDTHELIQHGEDLEIRTVIRIQGPLSFLWRKIVAENVAKDAPHQTEKLVQRVRRG